MVFLKSKHGAPLPAELGPRSQETRRCACTAGSLLVCRDVIGLEYSYHGPLRHLDLGPWITCTASSLLTEIVDGPVVFYLASGARASHRQCLRPYLAAQYRRIAYGAGAIPCTAEIVVRD